MYKGQKTMMANLSILVNSSSGCLTIYLIVKSDKSDIMAPTKM